MTNTALTKHYAHPYSAWERGTNENTNKPIRRFIPKGSDIGGFSHERIKMIEHWINNYPRKIFGGKSSNELKKWKKSLNKFCGHFILQFRSIKNGQKLLDKSYS